MEQVVGSGIDLMNDDLVAAHNALMVALARELELNRRSSRAQPKWAGAYLSYYVQHKVHAGEQVNG